jgi:hypothetical protein
VVSLHRVLVAQLVNESAETVTLVTAGDGSASGWRTPTLRWEVTGGGRLSAESLVRCGNINPLRKGEVFELATGKARALGPWVPAIHGIGPGTYRLRLSYVNDPSLEWQGVALGPHDVGEMARVRASTACRADSNEVTLTVQPQRR